jgi:hypothetical protein
MTVRTPNLAFRDLVSDSIDLRALHQARDRLLLFAANVIELQNANVALAAVNARVREQVADDEPLTCLSLRLRARRADPAATTWAQPCEVL